MRKPQISSIGELVPCDAQLADFVRLPRGGGWPA
jgi:hypothetical protein